jgi:hypothetical protein
MCVETWLLQSDMQALQGAACCVLQALQVQVHKESSIVNSINNFMFSSLHGH